MNEEQRRYLAHIGESDTEEILIKRTGWEAINLPTHTPVSYTHLTLPTNSRV